VDAARDDAARRVLEIAQTFFSYAKVDDRPHWAPGPCAPPDALQVERDAEPRISRAREGDAHGRKLYFLYAADAESYLHLPDAGASANPVGQALVKQAFAPREVTPGAPLNWSRHAKHRGHEYEPGESVDLFVMVKVGPEVAGADGGWIYGVVAPNQRDVKEAGKIERCIACHALAPHDRLFGPAKPAADE
jgi:hypothetical protein